jgi:Transposase DDE domain
LQFQQQGKKNFDKFFDKSVINKIGKKSGFIARKPQKITAYNFFVGFIVICCNGQNTFSHWALQISMLSKKSVSKQGVFSRIGESAILFSKQLLEEVLSKQITKGYASNLFEKFVNVLMQDSTTLRLPQVLSQVFKGNHSNGEQKAVARIQSVFSIKTMSFKYFSLGSFTQNDQSASAVILPLLKKGDLVIRDMGYFAIATFQKIIAAKAHFLSRLKYGVTISDKTGKVISLKDLLKQKHGVDKWVYIGVEKKIWVRLVMIPLPSLQVAEKIRKAKKDRDARLNHSEEYYQWLRFNIYITSVDSDVWESAQVGQAYKVRWQIEIIFKSWKSGFNLQSILHEGCIKKERVYVIIYFMLIFMCLVMKKIYVKYKNSIERKTTKIISLMKIAVLVSSNIKDVITMPQKDLKDLIMKHCCFEKRKDRINMTDLYKNNKN